MLSFDSILAEAAEIAPRIVDCSFTELIESAIEYCRIFKISSYFPLLFGVDDRAVKYKLRFEALYIGTLGQQQVINPEDLVLNRIINNSTAMNFLCAVFVKCFDAETLGQLQRVDQDERNFNMGQQMVTRYWNWKFASTKWHWNYRLEVEEEDLSTFPGAHPLGVALYENSENEDDPLHPDIRYYIVD